MDSNELSSSVDQAEDLSDRSESNSSSSRSSSTSGPLDTNLQNFHTYKNIEELTSNSSRHEDDTTMTGLGVQRFDDYAAARMIEATDMPIALDKPKDYAIQRADGYNESSASGPFRAIGSKELQGQKEAMYSFCREIREIRQKSLHAALERTAAVASGVTSSNKDLEIIKTYGLPIERMKDFGGLSSRIGSIALDRLRAGPLHGDGTSVLEPEDLKSLQQLQSRTTAGPQQVDATSMAFERLRHAHPLFQNANDTGQFSHSHQAQHSHHHPHHHHHSITQITQMQHATGTQHQQHQHQQAKSFTIDAILGLRGTNQRDKHQRHHPYRKHQGQEVTSKNLSSTGSCSNGNSNSGNSSSGAGKLKRVRTIFTAEQLERLEGEFARQQYMVGPERLYLAHALRLTEAQVKVWFQNRRIKWRKLNHEQHSQRLHELQQSGISERDDSNDNTAEW